MPFRPRLFAPTEIIFRLSRIRERNVSPAASPERDSGDSKMETKVDDVEKEDALHEHLITPTDASATFKQMQDYAGDKNPLLGTDDCRPALQTSS